MKLNDIFDEIYCINLDKRKDRWDECKNEFNKIGISVKRISAVEGNPDKIPMRMPRAEQNNKPGVIGCIQSHMKVMSDALHNGYDKILVLEDDIEFDENFNSKFEKFYNQLPNDWKLLYAGGSHRTRKLSKVNENVFKTQSTFTTHFIGIHSDVFKFALNDMKTYSYPVDWYYRAWQDKFPAYVFNPHLAWQRKSFSDIENHVTTYKFLQNFENKK